MTRSPSALATLTSVFTRSAISGLLTACQTGRCRKDSWTSITISAFRMRSAFSRQGLCCRHHPATVRTDLVRYLSALPGTHAQDQCLRQAGDRGGEVVVAVGQFGVFGVELGHALWRVDDLPQ